MAHSNRNSYFATRHTKVDFPRFAGVDLNGWLFICQHFFEVDQTPMDVRVKLAAINLEGKALQWHQNWTKFKKNDDAVTWEEYVNALEGRFSDHTSQDPMSELLSLRQTDKVSDYHDQFEALLGRVDLSEKYTISFFLNGLKNASRQPVKMFMPKNLNQAYALAYLQETTLKTLQQELNNTSEKLPPLLLTPKPLLLPTPQAFSRFPPRTPTF